MTAGACWLLVDSTEPPVRLTAGVCIIVPSGRPTLLATNPIQHRSAPETCSPQTRPGEVILHNGGETTPSRGTYFQVNAR